MQVKQLELQDFTKFSKVDGLTEIFQLSNYDIDISGTNTDPIEILYNPSPRRYKPY